MPSPGAFSSTTNAITEITNNTTPMIRTGRNPNDTNEQTSRIVPIVPEKMWPGTISSSTMRASPSQKKMNARFGSKSECRNPTNAPIRLVLRAWRPPYGA